MNLVSRVNNLLGLDSSSVRSQSALVRRVAENCRQHLTRRGHTVLTHGMAVELKRQFNIAVTKQCLDGLRVGSAANQERRQAVAKVVETRTGVDHPPPFAHVRPDAMKEFQPSLQLAADSLRVRNTWLLAF